MLVDRLGLHAPMRPLNPVAILIKGPTLLGVVLMAGTFILFPELRTPGDLLIAFGYSAVAGLLILTPIAAALAYRAPLERWLAPRACMVQWYASLVMMFSLGCLVASALHRASDALAALSLLALFMCAMLKVVCGIVLGSTRTPPSNAGGGPEPPPALVPRPPTGRPPELRAAAEPVHESAA
jgi:hypothetical protein